MKRRHLQVTDYTVGWICALPIELAAAQEMLDEDHESTSQDSFDSTLYSLGRIGEHNVVIACLPAGQTGTHSAAAVAVQMICKFTSIRFGLMVGIGGGVPGPESDIRLGDVVISQPHMQHGGIVQYDFGKTEINGLKKRTGSLNAPPAVLLHALSKLQALHYRGRSNFATYLSMFDNIDCFRNTKAGPDILFKATYNHSGGKTCDQCNTEMELKRPQRKGQNVTIHYGTIASGNQVIKDGVTRDQLSADLGGVMCFEMEAAGVMNAFPCLVIRGICDYADSHKNKSWQPYAAATASACAKEILSIIPAAKITRPCAKEAAEEYVPKIPLQILWQKPVVLNDARGRSFPFFLETINSKEFFVELLKFKFKDLGAEKINRGEWLLQDHYSKRILDFTRPWEAITKPGQILDMSMIFRKWSVSSTNCPICFSKNHGSAETQIMCYTCDSVYWCIKQIQEIVIQEEDSQISEGPAPSSGPKPPKPHDNGDDICYYSRVQVIDTKFRVQKAEESNKVAVVATLRLQDLENTEPLSERLAKTCGLSERDCQAALKECNRYFRVVRLLHLQDELSELEGLLMQIDMSDTWPRFLGKESIIPAPRQEVAQATDELQLHRTDILERINGKLAQYDEVFRECHKTLQCKMN
ncbi:nucleoside phosphorylase domain-containing protein [Xylogone sp. PMI_703]|nr:nucleoside phosphorylase domain-containing protein [Xylogone sp. PMI_703]